MDQSQTDGLNTLHDAIANAKLWERNANRIHPGTNVYIVRCHDGTYSITDQMPLIGEWYDADGIRHG